MNYEVIWRPSAEAALANLWLNAPDQPAVTAAADRIDVLLAKDPLDQGESRTGNDRRMFEPPPGILFEVRQSQKKVIGLKVWRFR